MEKYGVVLDDEKTKVAKATGNAGECPKCGTALYGNNESPVAFCPICGTEPFEKRPEEKR
jgi:hypothetical protein